MKLSEVLHYYLPYKLRIETYGLFLGYELTAIEYGDIIKKSLDPQWNWKPILKPLSSFRLTEENEDYFNGEDFRWIRVNDIEMVSFAAVKYLLENHYDIFGLIPEGLAIEKK